MKNGIALGLVTDDAREVAAPAPLLLPGRPLEEVDDVVGGEAVQRHPLDALDPPEVGEHVGERVAALQVGVSVGADDEQRASAALP